MRQNRISNPRYTHHIKIVRVWERAGDSDDPFEREESEEVRTILYEGEGREYTNSGTSGSGQVDTNQRLISIPKRFDDWKPIKGLPEGMSSWPIDGDTVEVTKGHIKETLTVKDFEPDNNRTVIYAEFVRA